MDDPEPEHVNPLNENIIRTLVENSNLNILKDIYITYPEWRYIIDSNYSYDVLSYRFKNYTRRNFLDNMIIQVKTKLYAYKKHLYNKGGSKINDSFILYKLIKKKKGRNDIINTTEQSIPINPKYVWIYFGLFDTTSPYYRAMVGEIPLSPDIFELLTHPNLHRRHYKLMQYGKRKVADYGPDIIEGNFGWKKNDLANAIKNSGVNLTKYILTGKQKDKEYKLPGFERLPYMRKIYYEDIYTKIFNTKAKSFDWNYICKNRLLSLKEMCELAPGTCKMSYDSICDLIRTDGKLSLRQFMKTSKKDLVTMFEKKGYMVHRQSLISEIYQMLPAAKSILTKESYELINNQWFKNLCATVDDKQLYNYTKTKVGNVGGITQLYALIVHTIDNIPSKYIRQYIMYLIYNYDQSLITPLKSLFDKMNQNYKTLEPIKIANITYRIKHKNRFFYNVITKPMTSNKYDFDESIIWTRQDQLDYDKYRKKYASYYDDDDDDDDDDIDIDNIDYSQYDNYAKDYLVEDNEQYQTMTNKLNSFIYPDSDDLIDPADFPYDSDDFHSDDDQ